jgi:hypothetical protein
MNIHASRSFALAAAATCALACGAAFAQADVDKRASEVTIYTLGDPRVIRYDVVSRPWADTWRSAFWSPTYPSEAEAIGALKAEAARRGADGLVNVICLDQRRPKLGASTDPAILCDGIAIRTRPGG